MNLSFIFLGYEDVKPLVEFLRKNEEKFVDFRPHVFTEEAIDNILSHTIFDSYYIIKNYNLGIVGYGMLRGEDEGYEIPTLGICIDPVYQGRGLGTLFINFLHSVAKFNGNSQVRIGVMKTNPRAKKLYENIGYEFTEEKEDRWYGYIELDN